MIRMPNDAICKVLYNSLQLNGFAWVILVVLVYFTHTYVSNI